MLRHIAVALDGSEHAARAGELAIDCARMFGAKLDLVHVVGPGAPGEAAQGFAEREGLGRRARPVAGAHDAMELASPVFEPARDDGALAREIGLRVVEPVRRAARARGLDEVHVEVLEGDPAEEIAGFVERAGIDMLFLGRRGLGRLRGLVLGSVSAKLASHADCTVVTVK